MQDERRTLISVRDHRCDPRDEIYSLARCNGNGVDEQLASSDKLTASAQTPGEPQPLRKESLQPVARQKTLCVALWSP